jgi:co-chaperonin GroES (HSP10)
VKKKNMKTTTNRVLVTGLDGSRWIDKIVTPGGLELYVAPTSKVATYDIKYAGYVIAVPGGLKGYRKNDTEVRLQSGMKVYFNYKTLMREPLMRERACDVSFSESEEFINIWECDYSEVFCYIEADGTIKPIGDWVLLEKIEHTEQLGSGVLINPFSEVKESHAKVYAISDGAQLNTTEGRIEPGDMVTFKHKEGAFENVIEGKTLWCAPADIIQAKI